MAPSETGAFLLVFCLAFSLTLMSALVMGHVGKRLGIVARAGGRHQTEGDRRQVSKLGGVALFLGFTVTVLVAQFLPIPRFDNL